jgi:hypothetical protein
MLIWLWGNNQRIKRQGLVIGMNANKLVMCETMNIVGYGKVWVWKGYETHMY